MEQKMAQVGEMAFCQLPNSDRVAEDLFRCLGERDVRIFMDALGNDNGYPGHVLDNFKGVLQDKSLRLIVTTLQAMQRHDGVDIIQEAIFNYKVEQNSHQELGDLDIHAMLELDSVDVPRNGLMNGGHANNSKAKYIMVGVCLAAVLPIVLYVNRH